MLQNSNTHLFCLYCRQKELAVQWYACRGKGQCGDLQHCGNSKGNQPCAQRLYPAPFWESAWHEDPAPREHLDQMLPWGKLIQENFAWQNEAPDSESGASCLSGDVLSLGGYKYAVWLLHWSLVCRWYNICWKEVQQTTKAQHSMTFMHQNAQNSFLKLFFIKTLYTKCWLLNISDVP